MDLNPGKVKNDLRNKLNEYKRVMKIARKPDREEFEMSAKITGAGILIIGVIGFIFYLATNLIPGYLG